MSIPDHWREILRMAQSVTPRAYLAGGALRDLDHDVPHKDLDIFFQSSGDTERDLGNLLEVFQGTTLQCSGEYLKCGDRDVGNVFAVDVRLLCHNRGNGCILHPLEHVQFIAMPRCETIHDVLNRLDFGICRIGFDGERVYRTVDYHQDCIHREFTLMPCADIDRSLRRWDRLKPRYPHYRLSLPA